MGATVARADDCGPRPTYAPQGQSFQQGSYQLQTQQVWVPGVQQQVWVPGECRQHRRWQRCTQGSYQTVVTQGHYENRQEWVWVASYDYQRPRYGQYGVQVQFGRGGRHGGRHHGAVPVGY